MILDIYKVLPTHISGKSATNESPFPEFNSRAIDLLFLVHIFSEDTWGLFGYQSYKVLLLPEESEQLVVMIMQYHSNEGNHHGLWHLQTCTQVQKLHNLQKLDPLPAEGGYLSRQI